MEDEIRAAAFAWLKTQFDLYGGVVPRKTIEHGFFFRGERVTLVGPSGIWKPRVFKKIPLSITSTYDGPYDDGFTEDGLIHYRYRGQDPNHRDNVGLREAMRTHTPLVYFHGVMQSKYWAVWPVYIIEDHPESLSCHVAIDPVYALQFDKNVAMDYEGDPSSGVRRYVASYTRTRLHQAAFRERVVAAYDDTCTLCNLHFRGLLDAAHIIPDSLPRGDPVVPNGLCLCKIHHSAYDQNIIGISPDYTVHVRSDVLDETDGPMLRHGLQGLHNQHIVLTGRVSNRPDRDRLAWRYERFLKAV